jgi:hypothetical protein
LSLLLVLVAMLVLVSVPAAAKTTRIPIVNHFIACEEAAVERMWVEGGVQHIRGRHLVGVVRSSDFYHAGPATSVVNANINLETGRGTFWGELEIIPTKYLNTWWEGSFSIQGLPGEQTGVARLKGYGELEGYHTKTQVTHMSGDDLLDLYPGVCGFDDEGNPIMPLGGSRADGFVMIPGGE